MTSLLNQLPFYEVVASVFILHSVAWSILLLLVARCWSLPVDRIRIMFVGGRVREYFGYRWQIGWIPLGASVNFAPVAFTGLSRGKRIALEATSLVSLMAWGWVFLEPNDIERLLRQFWPAWWEILVHPTGEGTVSLARFMTICDESTVRAAGMLSIGLLLLQFVPIAGMTFAGKTLEFLSPKSLRTPFILISGGIILWQIVALCLVYWTVAWSR